jgi:hypothetical protein
MEYKDFYKNVKIELRNLGFEEDRYISTPTRSTFYKKDSSNEYKYVFMSKDWGDRVRLSLAVSQLVINSIYDYGIQDSLLIEEGLVDIYNKYNQNDQDTTSVLQLNSFQSIEDAVERFLKWFTKSNIQFYKDSVEKLKSNSIIQKKYNYLKSIVEEYLDNKDIKDFDVEKLFQYLRVKYEGSKGVDFFANNLNANEIIKRNSLIIFSKIFEKKLNVSTNERDKFFIYELIRLNQNTGDEDLDMMFHLVPDKRAPVGNEDSAYYSTFMTFIEKAY